MGFCMRAVHSRNPGKHCINHLLSPDASVELSFEMEERGLGGGRDGCMDGRERKGEEERAD